MKNNKLNAIMVAALCATILGGPICGDGETPDTASYDDLVNAGKITVDDTAATLSSNDPNTAKLKVQVALRAQSDSVFDGDRYVYIDNIKLLNKTTGEDYGEIFPNVASNKLEGVFCQPVTSKNELILTKGMPEASCAFTVLPPNTIGKVTFTFTVKGRIAVTPPVLLDVGLVPDDDLGTAPSEDAAAPDQASSGDS